nr:AMP-binding protein [Micromonospora sp. DSM 115978]
MGTYGRSEPAFWNPRTETMPRQELAAWQLTKLQRALAHARRHSVFWRDRLPDGICSLADFSERVAPTRKKDLVEAQAAGPPYGTLPSTDPSAGVRCFQTSGTSGNTPFRTFETARDYAWQVGMWCTALYGVGIREHHTGCVAFGYGLFQGFWGMQDAMVRMGCTVLPTGSMDSRARVRLLVERGIEVVGSTPTYAMRLLETAREMGVDLAAEGNVRFVVTAAEPRSSSTVRALADGFGARVFDVAGMTELGTVFMFECPTRPGAGHIIEPGVIEEVLHPETGQPVADGERGVRVMTGLGREGLQVFRYWTEDLVVRRPWHECRCGRTWDWYDGGILGRSDDMRKVRGIPVTPTMVEDVVRGFDEVLEFQTILRRMRSLDTMLLRIEPRSHVSGDMLASLGQRVGAQIKEKIGLQPEVELAGPDTLPRFEAKAARFHDERER